MTMRLLVSLVLTVLLLGLGLAAAPKRPAQPAAPTSQQIEAAKKAGKVRVRLDTSKGPITVELDGKAAPITVANFLNLVKLGFYNGMPFHRVVPAFVIQAGDPRLVGRPPVNYTITDEKSPLKHGKGAIAMARSYRNNQMVPNSASTQFYITLAPQPDLDTLGFTVFGRVTKGMDVVEKIAMNDKITKAEVVRK